MTTAAPYERDGRRDDANLSLPETPTTAESMAYWRGDGALGVAVLVRWTWLTWILRAQRTGFPVGTAVALAPWLVGTAIQLAFLADAACTARFISSRSFTSATV